MTIHDPKLAARNFNGNHRPPRPIVPTAMRDLLTDPDIGARLDAAYRRDPQVVNEFVTHLRAFRRALAGDRVRPGEVNGDPTLPTEAMPFAAKEELRPDMQPGSENYNLMRGAVERLDAREMTEGLSERMREHDPGSGASLWDRMGAAPGPPSSDNPPTLRDSIQGAVDAASSQGE